MVLLPHLRAGLGVGVAAQGALALLRSAVCGRLLPQRGGGPAAPATAAAHALARPMWVMADLRVRAVPPGHSVGWDVATAGARAAVLAAWHNAWDIVCTAAGGLRGGAPVRFASYEAVLGAIGVQRLHSG